MFDKTKATKPSTSIPCVTRVPAKDHHIDLSLGFDDGDTPRLIVVYACGMKLTYV